MFRAQTLWVIVDGSAPFVSVHRKKVIMFSTADVGTSKVFKSISLVNTVTCVKFIDSFLLAGKCSDGISGILRLRLSASRLLLFAILINILLLVFLGIGNVLLVYNTDCRRLCLRRKIFDKATIHGIEFNVNKLLLAIHGENYVAIYSLKLQKNDFM